MLSSSLPAFFYRADCGVLTSTGMDAMADCGINGDSETPVTKPVILIVEDDAIIAAHHVQVLSSLGYTVLEPVATGEEAIGSVRAHKPDLVLMDIQLLGPMDGIETAGKIRAIADIPLVYITSYSDDVRLNQARVTEPYGYIVKPVESHELNATVRMALYKHALDRKLKASEEKYRDIFENSVTGLFRTTPSGQLIHANTALARMYGYTDSADMEKAGVSTWQLYADPEDRKRALSILAEKGTIENFEARHLRRDGTGFWVSITARTIRDDGGRVQSIEGAALDTTGRRQAEDAFQVMVRSMVGTTGLNSLHNITESVSSWLEADCVVIGELLPDRLSVKVISMLLEGKERPGFTYLLGGTPCGKVVEEGFTLYPDNAADLFPNSQTLADLHIRGYAGTPLRGISGEVIGILCVLSKNPLRPPPAMQEIMDIIAVKAAAEIGRSRGEAALRESEEQYRLLVENANDAIFLTEIQPNGMPDRFIMVNRVACQRSGYSYDELMQMSIRDLVVPDTSSKISDVGKKLLQDNRAVFEATHRRKDGTTFPVETSIHLFEMGGQRVSLTFSRDITERKATEAALRESELLLREVFDNANDAIFLLERTSAGPGKYLLVNEKAVRMLSYTKEELLTMSPRDIVPEEIQKKVMPAVIKKLLTDSHATFESAHRRKDGSIYPIEVSTHTFHYGGKDVDLSLVRDITERKQSEETLQKSEEKYRTLFESAGDIIFIHNREMRILAFNTFACERLGYTNQELQSMTIELVDSPEDTLHAPDRMARLVENGHLSFETRHRRKDGTLIPIMVSARMITWEGKPAVMSICHDITDLKRAEGALRQANRKLTLLSGITRHDINNQLTILIGFLTILEKKQNDPTIRKFFVKPILPPSGSLR